MDFKDLISFLLVLGIIHFDSTSGRFEPAYLKVCGKNEKHIVDSKYCEKGVWLKHPLEPGCLCVRGVWALSNGFCDEKPVIIVGDGHCFHIGFEIRAAKLIGNPDDPFHPKIYSAPSSLDAFFEVEEKGYTPSLVSDTTFVIGVNPRQVAQRKDFGVCLDLPPDDWNKPVHIYANPRRSVKEWTLNPKDLFNCPVVASYKYHVGFGEMFMNGRVEPKILVERECQEDCPGGNNTSNSDAAPMHPMGRSLGDVLTQQDQNDHRYNQQPAATSASSNLPPNQTVRSFTKLYNRHRPSKTPEEIQEEKDEARARVEEDEEIFARETNEQTLRMMHAHISPLLLNVSGAQVKTRAYEYLQILRKVVEKGCPNDFISPILLRGVMRMFRQLLWETEDTFTPIQHGDEDAHRRTLDVLSFCLNSTPPHAITFNTLNDSYSNDTDLRDTIPLVNQWPNWAVPPERCPEPIIFSLNGSFYRRTFEEWTYIRNITMIGIHLKFNVTELDFVIETAWKIALMGSYRCSWHFNETSYADYYTFIEQTRSFFNEKIKKRWYYLPSVQKTYEIVKMMFPAHNLKKFAFGLDACMLGFHRFGAEFGSARIVSRPKLTATEDDLSQSVKYYDRYDPANAEVMKTHALKSTDYAPKPEWPDIYFPKKGDTYPEQYIYKGKRRRRRNAAVSESFNMWGNTATCIRGYSEPWSRGQALGYHVPPGCRSPTGIYN